MQAKRLCARSAPKQLLVPFFCVRVFGGKPPWNPQPFQKGSSIFVRYGWTRAVLLVPFWEESTADSFKWSPEDSLYDDAEEVVGMLAWFSLSCKAVNDVASDKFQAEPRHPQSDRFFWCRVSRVFIFWEATRGCRLDRVCRPGILP